MREKIRRDDERMFWRGIGKWYHTGVKNAIMKGRPTKEPAFCMNNGL